MADYWFPMALKDPALLHTFIACAGAYASGYTSNTYRTRGLKHLQESISIVNKRLAGEEAFTPVTLSIIAGMAMMEVRYP
jgi:hypothetical protein